MKALILAAGRGERLAASTQAKPKAMVQVAGQPLMAHVLQFLTHPDIEGVGVVVGAQSDMVTEWLEASQSPVRIFHNREHTRGNLLSLFAGREFFDDDILLCNVDHLYPATMLDRLARHETHITAACDFDRTLVADDMKIARNARGHLGQIHKQLPEYCGGYIGMTRIPYTARTLYLDAAEATADRFGPDAAVEWVLGELAVTGHPVEICDVSGIGWVEVDEPCDLGRAEAFLRQQALRAA
ncbi:MAG: NTP transferase domain-containing protein [Deltaproteobacteria bacterium]|nr:NTP transferase domain-containing protein [Deltaproteobacteria bacterium]